MMTPLNGPGEKDWNKGFKNALKMKMNGKIRELRDSLEPKPKKALRELKSPFLFLSNSKEELKTKDHYSRKTPDSFLPDIFSSPFQEPQPRDPWAVKVPPFYLSKPQPQPQGLGQDLLLPKESDWRLSLGATQDKMMRVRERRQNIQPKAPVDFRAKKKEVIRPRTPPMNFRLRPELAVTQDKMARVREWRQNVQPEAPAPVDFRVPKKVAKVGKRREREVIQPRTPPMDFRLRPELAVTEDKMARVREWRERIQPEPPRDVLHRKRPNIAAAINHINRVDFRLRPELDVTQNKMVRVREWRERIQLETRGEPRARGRERRQADQKRNQFLPGLSSTLQNNNEMDWLNGPDQSLQPREQRRKADRAFGIYLEAGNIRKEEKENDDTLAFMKIFE